MEKNKKITLLIELFFAILFCFFVGSSNSGSIFLGDINVIDEGQFAAWAYHMTQGSHMYKDVFIAYGPLYVYPLFVLFKIFGSNILLVRIYQSIGAVIGIVCLWIISRKLKFSNTTRRLLLLLSLLLPITQLRQAAGFLVIICFLKMLDNKYIVWSILTGVFLSTSFLMSPDIGIFSFIVVSIGAIYAYFKKFLHIKSFLFLITSGLVVFYLFFLWSNKEGWFTDYLQVTQDVLLTFSGIQVPNGQNFPSFLGLVPHTFNIKTWIVFLFSKDILVYWLALFYEIVFVFIIINLILRKSIKSGLAFCLIALYGFLLYTILLTRNGIGHFFFVLSPALVLLFYFVDTQVFAAKKSFLMIGICFLTLFFSIRLILINRVPILNMLAPYNYISSNRINLISVSSQQENHLKSIHSFVEKNTTKNEYVFFLSDEPFLYMLTQRKNPTRYDLPFIANTIDKRIELVNDIVKNKPKFIFYNEAAWAVDGVDSFTRIPEIKDVLTKYYQKIPSVGSEIVYKLK